MNWFHDYWWVVLVAVLLLPIICVAAFGWWLNRRPNLQLDEGVKCWDVFVKLITALTVVASGAILIGKYVDQREQADYQQVVRERREGNLRSAEFLRQKLIFDTERHQRTRKLFDEAKILAARLGNATTSVEADVKRFNELYFGDLIGVERSQGPVERAMVQFRFKLNRDKKAPADSLDQLALQLAEACEKEIKDSEHALLEQHKAIADLVTIGGEKP